MTAKKKDSNGKALVCLVLFAAFATTTKHAAEKIVSAHTTSAAAPVVASGSVAVGQQMAAARGWTGAQWSCLYALWNKESGWDVLATYPSHDTPPSAPSSSITTAYGIPQALHAQNLASAGPDWRTDPATQIRWGLGYIAGRYGTPCAAESHELAKDWY